MNVNHVDSSSEVFVKLGVSAKELSSLPDLYTALGITNPNDAHQLFNTTANPGGASLVLSNKAATSLLGNADANGNYNEQKVTDIVKQLTKLGFTQIDIVNPNTTVQPVKEFLIDKSTLSLQTHVPTPTTVQLLGVHHDTVDPFDLTHNWTTKH